MVSTATGLGRADVLSSRPTAARAPARPRRVSPSGDPAPASGNSRAGAWTSVSRPVLNASRTASRPAAWSCRNLRPGRSWRRRVHTWSTSVGCAPTVPRIHLGHRVGVGAKAEVPGGQDSPIESIGPDKAFSEFHGVSTSRGFRRPSLRRPAITRFQQVTAEVFSRRAWRSRQESTIATVPAAAGRRCRALADLGGLPIADVKGILAIVDGGRRRVRGKSRRDLEAEPLARKGSRGQPRGTVSAG